LALLGAGRAEASVTIQSFSLVPASPNTGDQVILSAVIESTSSCNFVDATGGRSSYGRTSDGFRRIDTSHACP